MTTVEMLRACGDNISNAAADEIENLQLERARLYMLQAALINACKLAMPYCKPDVWREVRNAVVAANGGVE